MLYVENAAGIGSDCISLLHLTVYHNKPSLCQAVLLLLEAKLFKCRALLAMINLRLVRLFAASAEQLRALAVCWVF